MLVVGLKYKKNNKKNHPLTKTQVTLRTSSSTFVSGATASGAWRPSGHIFTPSFFVSAGIYSSADAFTYWELVVIIRCPDEDLEPHLEPLPTSTSYLSSNGSDKLSASRRLSHTLNHWLTFKLEKMLL